jgi:hypothetical protein
MRGAAQAPELAAAAPCGKPGIGDPGGGREPQQHEDHGATDKFHAPGDARAEAHCKHPGLAARPRPRRQQHARCPPWPTGPGCASAIAGRQTGEHGTAHNSKHAAQLVAQGKHQASADRASTTQLDARAHGHWLPAASPASSRAGWACVGSRAPSPGSHGLRTRPPWPPASTKVAKTPKYWDRRLVHRLRQAAGKSSRSSHCALRSVTYGALDGTQPIGAPCFSSGAPARWDQTATTGRPQRV